MNIDPRDLLLALPFVAIVWGFFITIGRELANQLLDWIFIHE